MDTKRTVVAVCLIVRILQSTLLVKTYFNPDEYWQSLEVAHRLVFGYDCQLDLPHIDHHIHQLWLAHLGMGSRRSFLPAPTLVCSRLSGRSSIARTHKQHTNRTPADAAHAAPRHTNPRPPRPQAPASMPSSLHRLPRMATRQAALWPPRRRSLPRLPAHLLVQCLLPHPHLFKQLRGGARGARTAPLLASAANAQRRSTRPLEVGGACCIERRRAPPCRAFLGSSRHVCPHVHGDIISSCVCICQRACLLHCRCGAAMVSRHVYPEPRHGNRHRCHAGQLPRGQLHVQPVGYTIVLVAPIVLTHAHRSSIPPLIPMVDPHAPGQSSPHGSLLDSTSSKTRALPMAHTHGTGTSPMACLWSWQRCSYPPPSAPPPACASTDPCRCC